MMPTRSTKSKMCLAVVCLPFAALALVGCNDQNENNSSTEPNAGSRSSQRQPYSGPAARAPVSPGDTSSRIPVSPESTISRTTSNTELEPARPPRPAYKAKQVFQYQRQVGDDPTDEIGFFVKPAVEIEDAFKVTNAPPGEASEIKHNDDAPPKNDFFWSRARRWKNDWMPKFKNSQTESVSEDEIGQFKKLCSYGVPEAHRDDLWTYFKDFLPRDQTLNDVETFVLKTLCKYEVPSVVRPHVWSVVMSLLTELDVSDISQLKDGAKLTKLKEVDRSCVDAALQVLCRYGIPDQFRRIVYPYKLNVPYVYKPGHFDDLKNSDIDESLVNQLKLDIGRTQSDHVHFAERSDGLPQPDGQQELYEILHAIVAKHPDLGYTQGMNVVAAHFMLIFPDDPESSFWCFLQLLDDPTYGFKEYYRLEDDKNHQSRGVLADVEVLRVILKSESPDLYKWYHSPSPAEFHLTSMMGFYIFFWGWLPQMFAVFPWPIRTRMFDLLVSEGFVVNIRVFVALFKRLEKQIKRKYAGIDEPTAHQMEQFLRQYLKTGDSKGIVPWFQQLGDPAIVMNEVFAVDLSTDNIRQMRSEAWDRVHKGGKFDLYFIPGFHCGEDSACTTHEKCTEESQCASHW